MNFKINQYISSILICLLIISTFNNSNNIVLRNLGFFSIVFILIFNFVFLFLPIISRIKKIEKELKRIFLIGLIIIIWTAIGIAYSGNTINGFKILLQSALLLIFGFTLSNIELNSYNIKSFKFPVLFFLMTNILYLVSNYNVPEFTFLFSNPNPYAAIMYYMIFFVLLIYYEGYIKIRFKLYLIIVTVVSIILTKSMAILLACIVSFGICLFWNIISRNKFIHSAFFNITIILLFLFTFIYPQLYLNSNYDFINYFFTIYTGQRFYSGRNLFWRLLIQLIKNKIIFGYGTGVLAGDLINITLSAHNLYLQLWIQNGFIGLVLLIILLKSVWDYLFTNSQDKIVKITSSYVIGIIIHQTFEVTLLQNNVSIGLLQWFILGVGLSRNAKINKNGRYKYIKDSSFEKQS